MTYSYGFKKQFAIEFSQFPTDQQEKIFDFLDTYINHGLADFSKYEGKISPSWSGDPNTADYKFAFNNDLWHYHIGIPNYSINHSKYKTSDWVLHFQWIHKGTHIDLVDIYSHYRRDGTFHIPAKEYLQE